jgi:hypothetical protein
MTRKHTPQTKQKIAASNSGKIFSEERRANISKSLTKEIKTETLLEIAERWKKRYVPAKEIRAQFGLSDRIYRRILKENCEYEQIKHLDQTIASTVYENLISFCEQGIPYKDIAEKINLSEKWTRHAIVKLSKFYNIQPLPRKQEKTLAHKAKLREAITAYNIANPKKREENPNWKGGITDLADSIRKSDKYKAWRLEVLKADGYKCIHCESKKKLQVDHIYQFVLLIEDGKITNTAEADSYGPLWNVRNGRTLCEICHRKTETFGKQRKQGNK